MVLLTFIVNREEEEIFTVDFFRINGVESTLEGVTQKSMKNNGRNNNVMAQIEQRQIFARTYVGA